MVPLCLATTRAQPLHPVEGAVRGRHLPGGPPGPVGRFDFIVITKRLSWHGRHVGVSSQTWHCCAPSFWQLPLCSTDASPWADQHPCGCTIASPIHQIFLFCPPGQSHHNTDPWSSEYPLTKHLRLLISISLAQATKGAYATGMRQFRQFCKTHRVTALPATKQILAHFAAHLSLRGLSPSIINGYLAAVRTRHKQLGLPDPGHHNHTLTLAKWGAT